MSSVKAVTEDVKFEARIASFYEMNSEASEELLLELSRVFEQVGKKHGFLVWRVQIVRENK
jgi:hypothetical protein